MARKKNYLNNKDLMAQFLLSKEQNRMTEEFAKMIMTLARRYASKPNFSGYSYIEDMEAFAILQVCRAWHQFNPEKSNNPFAYYTQFVKNSFFQFLGKEKRVREIRDRELTFAGKPASFTYQQNQGEVTAAESQ